MDTIRAIMPYFSLVLSCIAIGISIASLMNNVDEELKILEEVMDYLEEEYERQKQ